MGVSIPNANAGCPGSNFPGSVGRSFPDGTIVNGPPVFAGGPMGPPLGSFPGGGMFPPSDGSMNTSLSPGFGGGLGGPPPDGSILFYCSRD